MPWLDEHLEALTKPDHWGYRPGDVPAAEPCALGALTLIGHGRVAQAKPLLDKLCDLQAADGSVGIYDGANHPHWVVPHAILAWSAAIGLPIDPAERQRLKDCVVRSCEFLLKIEGRQILPEHAGTDVGHDTMLVGWPWVESTHSWQEPTAFALLALKAAGRRSHPRADEAVRLLLDRILPGGGCNYGNTYVLGQQLRPHLQPTGIMLLALANETDRDGRIAKSVTYIGFAVHEQSTAASLACAVLGLAAQHVVVANSADSLDKAVALPSARIGAYLPRLSWAALAVLGKDCPLVKLSREGMPA